MPRKISFLMLLFAALLMGLPACSTAPKHETAKAQLHDEAQLAMRSFVRKDSSLDQQIQQAHGYVIFPQIGKGGVLLAGGSFGRGEVYREGQLIGFASVSQATVGPQLGGQTIRELILFENEDALTRFINGKLTFSARHRPRRPPRARRLRPLTAEA